MTASRPHAGAADGRLADADADAVADVGGPVLLGRWLRDRARVGVLGNLVVFVLLAATAASRAAHEVLSPAGLVAVVVGAALAATTTGWVTGFYEGVEAALLGRVEGARPGPDQLAGATLWHRALRWAAGAALWSAAGSIVLAAVLGHRSAPFPVLAVALLALAAPAAVAVDVAARAAGVANGTTLLAHRPPEVPLLRRAWRDLALPVALVQVVVNAGGAWVLFHGAAGDGTLTKSAAFADAIVVAALLATVFGALGNRWGAVEAASGRIAVEGDRGRRHPMGPQALVYAGAVMVVTTSLVGVVVPSHPSLWRVAVVRGLLAGALTAVACALGVVRGVANAAPPALDPARLPLPEPDPAADFDPAPRRGRWLRAPRRSLRSAGGAAATAVLLLIGATPLVTSPPAEAGELAGLGLVGELDAFGVRVEYDIPAPVSGGSLPQVVGSVRRSAGSESASGIAASPSRLDPVVGGTVSNLDKEPRSGDEVNLPQAECAYPGALADVAFTFPADLRPDAAGSPPVGWSSAQCGAGPTVDLRATGASPDRVGGLGPAVTVGGVVGQGSAGPDEGVLSATASASASEVSILGGLIRVDSISARGASHTNGKAGGATTEAFVDLSGVSVAGTRFDLRDGDLVVDGTPLPVGGSAAGAVLKTVSQALAPSGCRLSILDSPSAYPQGFLFSRPEPTLGVADDGTAAASMTGGLLVQCDIPHDLAYTTGFSPQRAQIVLGFVYTGVSAREDIGGFGLGHIGGGTTDGGSGAGLAAGSLSGESGFEAPALEGGTTPTAGPPPARPSEQAGSGGQGPSSVTERIELLAANFADGRPWLWVAALAVWLLLTHRGLERVRSEVVGASA